MLYDILIFVHIISFVFMSIPLFNLIAVNERAKIWPRAELVCRQLYGKHHSWRRKTVLCLSNYPCCFPGFFSSFYGPLGIGALYTNWVLLVKTILLFALVGSLFVCSFLFAAENRCTVSCFKTGQPEFRRNGKANKTIQGPQKKACRQLSVFRHYDNHIWYTGLHYFFPNNKRCFNTARSFIFMACLQNINSILLV